jgi:hypothetical protein
VNNAELFIRNLDSITGRPEDVIRQVKSTDPGLPHVSIFVYKNWPKEGILTGFTFGLSAAEHPDWKLGKPELMISVESQDDVWPFAIGYLAEKLRGKFSFCYGKTINFNAKVSKEAELDAFLMFAPLFLKKEQMAVKLRDFTCNITGMYPMFSSEFSLYQEIGLKAFWNLAGWDPLNVHRRPLREQA